jgi:hypothetical protein
MPSSYLTSHSATADSCLVIIHTERHTGDNRWMDRTCMEDTDIGQKIRRNQLPQTLHILGELGLQRLLYITPQGQS